MAKMNVDGKRFGRLIAIREIERRNNARYYLCQCDCGEMKEVGLSSLNAGRIQSCGCLRKERLREKLSADLKGQRFGKLIVINRIYVEGSDGAIWECQCDCGTVKNIRAKSLLAGTIKGCGCLIDPEKARLGMRQKTVESVQVPRLQQKLSKNNESGVKGVYVTTNRKGEKIYVAKIQVKGKAIHLGSSPDLDVATRLRKEGERKYHRPYIEQLEEKENEN